MGEGLSDLWGLGESDPGEPQSESQAESRSAFGSAITAVNKALQSAITNAAPDEHAALGADRDKIYQAYQVASSQLSQDESAGQAAMDRVLAAAETLGGKATEVANAATAAHEQWLAREEEFDEAVLQIGQLEDAGHPKGAALRQIANTIRDRVGQRSFDAGLSALDSMAPKLSEYARDLTVADQADGDVAPGAALATLEVRVSYQGTAVPGAMVRLSTGPTGRPDATTDANGIATFRDVEPGAYHLNAAKRAFVFQPAFVREGSLAGGAVYPVHISKAAQGQPPAPSYLYGGGAPTATPGTGPPGGTPPGGRTTPGTGPPGGTPPGGTVPPGPGGTTPGIPGGGPPSLPGETPPAALATVEVHVHDENGAPVDKAMVRISTGPTSPPDGQTNSAGIASFQLAPGEYHVNAAKRDVVWQPAYVAPGKLQPGATYPVTLNKPHYPEADGETSSLTVRVAWGDGDPVDGARVDVDGNPKYSAPTDSTGFVRFEKVPVGPHSVQATHVSSEYGTVSRSATATVTKGKQVTKSISLSKGANLFTIHVAIMWKTDGLEAPGFVEGALVTITPANAPPAVTNVAGGAVFSDLPAGNYTVSAIISETAQTITSTNVILNEDLDSRYAGVRMVADRDSDPSVPDDKSVGQLTVNVLREGTDLEAVGATVSLSPATVGPEKVEAVSGAFFRAVPAGRYTVTATLTEDDGAQSTASGQVTVDANVRKETGLMLEAASTERGSLIVTVYDNETGGNLSGVLVSLNEFAGSEFTNSGGIAQFPKLPPGQYVVTAHPDSGYRVGPDAQPVVRQVEVEDGRTTSIQIPMEGEDAPKQTGTIYVTVSTADGKDLDFTYVSLHPEVHPPQMAGTGRVQFSNVPVGDYVVQANLDDKVARQEVSLDGFNASASAVLVVG